MFVCLQVLLRWNFNHILFEALQYTEHTVRWNLENECSFSFNVKTTKPWELDTTQERSKMFKKSFKKWWWMWCVYVWEKHMMQVLEVIFLNCCPHCPSCPANAFQMGQATRAIWAVVKNIFFVQVWPKYYPPHVRPYRGSNAWPPDHDSTFQVTETPALTTQPSVAFTAWVFLCFWDLLHINTSLSLSRYYVTEFI